MANRTTLAYGKPDARWAKEFDNQLQVAAAKKLVSLLQARRAGKVIAVGPGAARFHAGLDKVNDVIEQSTVLRAQLADEHLEITLLRDEFADLHLGTVNHYCLWNAPHGRVSEPTPARTAWPDPTPGDVPARPMPQLGADPRHEPIRRMEEADLVSLLKKKLSPEEVLAEWDARVARPVLRTPGEVQRDETIADLRSRLPEANTRATEAQGKLDALATVTANLYYENLELRKKESTRRQGRVTALPASGPWLE